MLESHLELSITSKEENPATVALKQLQTNLRFFFSNLISKVHMYPVHHGLSSGYLFLWLQIGTCNPTYMGLCLFRRQLLDLWPLPCPYTISTPKSIPNTCNYSHFSATHYLSAPLSIHIQCPSCPRHLKEGKTQKEKEGVKGNILD